MRAVLHILLRVIEARLRQGSRCARGRQGVVSFAQRFGGTLNAHVHFHCCVIDGMFAVGEGEQVHLAGAGALTPEDLAAVRHQVRARVLRWFAHSTGGRPILIALQVAAFWPRVPTPGCLKVADSGHRGTNAP